MYTHKYNMHINIIYLYNYVYVLYIHAIYDYAQYIIEIFIFGYLNIS